MQRKRGLWRAAPRSRAGKLAVLAPSIGVMGYICARLIVLLADVRPYIGWDWVLAVASGIVVAVALPWAFVVGGSRSSGRWPAWLLIGYIVAVAGGMRYYLALRFTAPGHVPAVLSPPPLWFVLKIAGLSAVTLTVVAITLLMLVVLAEVIAPGPVGRWLQARPMRRAAAARHPGPADERIPARLLLEAPGGGPSGRWVRGAIHVRPGSLLWEPAKGVQAAPAELVSATVVLEGAGQDAKSGRAVTVDTPAGRIQLECGAEIFTLLQRIATELATSSQAQTTAGER
jgi:hypothetical protein